MGYMKLALRRFEIFVVFAVAVVCAYFAAGYFFSVLPLDPTVYLIPRPAVMNEKEALLEALRTDSQNVPEEEKARVLHSLSASNGKATTMSAEEKLKMLEAVRASSRR